jgi:hypothetical protein
MKVLGTVAPGALLAGWPLSTLALSYRSALGAYREGGVGHGLHA